MKRSSRRLAAKQTATPTTRTPPPDSQVVAVVAPKTVTTATEPIVINDEEDAEHTDISSLPAASPAGSSHSPGVLSKTESHSKIRIASSSSSSSSPKVKSRPTSLSSTPSSNLSSVLSPSTPEKSKDSSETTTSTITLPSSTNLSMVSSSPKPPSSPLHPPPEGEGLDVASHAQEAPPLLAREAQGPSSPLEPGSCEAMLKRDRKECTEGEEYGIEKLEEQEDDESETYQILDSLDNQTDGKMDTEEMVTLDEVGADEPEQEEEGRAARDRGITEGELQDMVPLDEIGEEEEEVLAGRAEMIMPEPCPPDQEDGSRDSFKPETLVIIDEVSGDDEEVKMEEEAQPEKTSNAAKWKRSKDDTGCIEWGSCSRRQFIRLNVRHMMLKNLPPGYGNDYTEDDIDRLLKPFTFVNIPERILVVPEKRMAVVEMPSAARLFDLLQRFKERPLQFKGSTLSIHRVVEDSWISQSAAFPRNQKQSEVDSASPSTSLSKPPGQSSSSGTQPQPRAIKVKTLPSMPRLP